MAEREGVRTVTAANTWIINDGEAKILLMGKKFISVFLT